MTFTRDEAQPKLNDLKTYFVREFVREYKDRHMSRRDTIRRVLYITGGIAPTAMLLTGLRVYPEHTGAAWNPEQ